MKPKQFRKARANSGFPKPVTKPGRLSHLDRSGQAQMVNISGKDVIWRKATAAAEVRMKQSTLNLIQQNSIAKGNVLATARIAGIQAAKRTAELIPLCHSLRLTHCEVVFALSKNPVAVKIAATAITEGRTGVEMEALTAVVVAGLTIYDMCKAVDKTMRIESVKLLEKLKRPQPF